jgi:hypothetical protein
MYICRYVCKYNDLYVARYVSTCIYILTYPPMMMKSTKAAGATARPASTEGTREPIAIPKPMYVCMYVDRYV